LYLPVIQVEDFFCTCFTHSDFYSLGRTSLDEGSVRRRDPCLDGKQHSQKT